jgi:hypothetical protein
MPDFRIEIADGAASPGEAYLCDTPVLRTHAGTQPDLFLRWNAIPLAAAAVDIVVFLHGFSQEGGAMLLSEKVARSGLDLSDRDRPTLALLPRGNWIRHYYYDFPALLGGGIDRLVDYGLGRLAAAMPGGRRLAADRLILAAHSGGGMPAIDIIAGAARQPDELFVFDGLYGRDPRSDEPLRGVEVIDGWLGERLARESEPPGALRIVYFERQTGPFSREAGAAIGRRLAGLDPALSGRLSRRYRIEISGVPHARIAQRCLPDLLASSDAEFDWSR